MSQTEVYVSHFYLVSDKKSIEVKAPCTLGRSNGDIVINDAKLSGSHCEFTKRGISLFVKDLGSTNGTHVNGEKLAAEVETKLQYGDKLHLGSTIFELNETPELKSSPVTTDHKAPSFAELISIKNIFSFYGASLGAKVFYWCVVALYLSLSSMILLTFEITDLGYILSEIVFALTFAFSLTLFISYLRAYYFKKSAMLSVFIASISFVVSFMVFCLLIAGQDMEYNQTRFRVLELIKDKGLMQKDPKKSVHEIHQYIKAYKVAIKTSPERKKFYIKEFKEITQPIANKAKILCPEIKELCEIESIIETGSLNK